MLHRQSFSIEQGTWMVEEYEKRGFKILTINKTKAKEPSLVLTKTGQPKIVLHYTAIGGYDRYYCMVFPENTDIPGHPFEFRPSKKFTL